MTRRRVFLAVSGIWLTACCLFIVWYGHIKNYSVQFRSLCHIPDSIAYFMDFFIAYIPLTLIFFLNFQVLSLARKQRTRIFPKTKTTSGKDCHNRESTKKASLNLVLEFFVAFKAAKTFGIVVAVLAFCILTPTVVGQGLHNTICSNSCLHIWYVLFNYELYGINSIVATCIRLRNETCKI